MRKRNSRGREESGSKKEKGEWEEKTKENIYKKNERIRTRE